MELSRRGPGILLRDIEHDSPPVKAVVAVLAEAAPDAVLLTGFDWDHGNVALGALADKLAEAGHPMPHLFAAEPNAGRPSGLDLDGDGRLGGPGDALGWGRFRGHGGMAVLSVYPLTLVRDLSGVLWRDAPGLGLPEGFYSPAALDKLPVSSVAHWELELQAPGGALRLLAFSANPPVFDGPEDRNGLRNAAEILLWSDRLADRAGPPVVVMGNANLDPDDGEGRHEAIRALLGHPRLTDPRPASAGAVQAARGQGGANARHAGDPALDTADWSDGEDGPGNLRISYVLPDARLHVTGAGVLWPRPADRLGKLLAVEEATRHRLVWVDVEF